MVKKILVVLLILLMGLQFVRPVRNKSNAISPNDITNHYQVPDTVLTILKASCYDCHSNNTIYPWYTNIQPFGLWMQGHVNDGKRGLNFSEFATYQPGKQMKKLIQTMDEIKKGDMPLNSYLWIHRYASLTGNQKGLLINWADSLKTRIGQINNISDAEADQYH